MLRMVLLLGCSIMLMGCSATLDDWGWTNNNFSADYAEFKDDTQNCEITSSSESKVNYDRLTRYNVPMRVSALHNGRPRTHYRDFQYYGTPSYFVKNRSSVSRHDDRQTRWVQANYYGANQDKAFNYCMVDKGWKHQQVGS